MEEKGKYFRKNYELARMASYSNYPEALLEAMQVKSLVGRRPDAMQDPDISVSAFRLEPGTVYGARGTRNGHPLPAQHAARPARDQPRTVAGHHRRLGTGWRPKRLGRHQHVARR